MYLMIYKLTFLAIIICCSQITKKEIKQISNLKEIEISKSNILKDRILPPPNFKRIKNDSNSFAYYLQHLPLKPDSSQVLLYNGEVKENEDIYCAVVNMDIGTKDLQQCADAVMRLRAEYLYQQKKYNDIKFQFVNGQWQHYKTYAANDYSYKKFRKYMEYVFSYANTASLKKQLQQVPFYSIQSGDVLVQSGSPYGHAVIVVDICQNEKSEKQFLLAQSYMPAQETQILLNPNTLKPWYNKPLTSVIETPEWTFDTLDLRRWRN